MINMIFSLSVTVLLVAFFIRLVHQERKNKRFAPFTENILRSPGYTLRKQLDDEADKILAPFLMAAIIPFVFFGLSKNATLTTMIIAWSIAVIFIVLALVKIKKVFDRVKNLRVGYEGENYTGQELNFLMREGAWVYHDIPYKYGNIDHIVISKAGVFPIETKTFRKPSNAEGKKEYQLKVSTDALIFPHFKTSDPIQQAKRHADYLKKLFKNLNLDNAIFPVIAVPGWLVEEGKDKKGFKVINPKNGAKGLKRYLAEKERITEDQLQVIIEKIESVVRTVDIKSNMTDPDADKNYTLFLDRKPEEKKL